METIRRRLGSNSEVTWILHGGFENVLSCLIFGIYSEAFEIVFQYSKLLFRNSKLWFPNNYSEIPSLTWNFYTRVAATFLRTLQLFAASLLQIRKNLPLRRKLAGNLHHQKLFAGSLQETLTIIYFSQEACRKLLPSEIVRKKLAGNFNHQELFARSLQETLTIRNCSQEDC